MKHLGHTIETLWNPLEMLWNIETLKPSNKACCDDVLTILKISRNQLKLFKMFKTTIHHQFNILNEPMGVHAWNWNNKNKVYIYTPACV